MIALTQPGIGRGNSVVLPALGLRVRHGDRTVRAWAAFAKHVS